MINEPVFRSNWLPIISSFDNREQLADLSGSDNVSHTLLNTEIAEISAGVLPTIEAWNWNRGPCANVPLLARLSTIHEEEPYVFDVTDEGEPHHLDTVDNQGPHNVEVPDERDPHHVDNIVEGTAHLIEFNDQEELRGLESQYHGLNTYYAPRELEGDYAFWPVQPTCALRQSALILSPFSNPEFLPPETLSHTNSALTGTFAISIPCMAEDLKRFTTVLHDLQSDFDHHTPSFDVFPTKPLSHSSSMSAKAIGNADRFATARSTLAEIETNFASSRLQVGSSKLEEYGDRLGTSFHCNAVDRFYGATTIVDTISQFAVPRDCLDWTQVTSSHVDAQTPTSDCSTWTSAHSSLNTSLSLKTIQALLDALPFEGLLTTATLGDKNFYSSAKTYCKTLRKLESEAKPRYRFSDGKMAESDQTRLMCRAYPEMVCDCCSRKFGGQDRKRELACHRKEKHEVTTDSFSLVDGECGGAGSPQRPKDIFVGLDTTYKLLAQGTESSEASELQRAFSFEDDVIEKLSEK